jgi:type II secretory pathway component PulF
MTSETKRVHIFWKYLSIILVIFIILVFIFLYMAVKQYQKDILNEEICVKYTCGPDYYTSYYYNAYDKTCSCYDKNGLSLKEVMK